MNDLSTRQCAALSSALSHPFCVMSADAKTVACLCRYGLCLLSGKLTPKGIQIAEGLSTAYATCSDCGEPFETLASVPRSYEREYCHKCMIALGQRARGARSFSEIRKEEFRRIRIKRRARRMGVKVSFSHTDLFAKPDHSGDWADSFAIDSLVNNRLVGTNRPGVSVPSVQPE